MITRTYVFSLLMLLSVLPSVAQQRLSLNDCLRLARGNDKTLKVSEAELKVANTMIGTAWEIEKTSVSYTKDNKEDNIIERQLTISQDIDFPTVYVHQRKAYKAEANVKAMEHEMKLRQLDADVMQLYYTMMYVEHMLKTYYRIDEILQAYLSNTMEQHKDGTATQLQVITARRMCLDNSADIMEYQNKLFDAQTELQRIVNMDGMILPADTALSVLVIDVEPQLSYGTTTEGQYLDACLAAGRQQISLARQDYLPSLSLALHRYEADYSGYKPHVSKSLGFTGFEVGVGIPLFYGATRNKVKAAKHEQAVRQMEAEASKASAETKYKQIYQDYLNLKRSLELYQHRSIADADEIVRLSKEELRNGNISYLEYTSNLHSAMETYQKYANVINDMNQLCIEVIRMKN